MRSVGRFPRHPDVLLYEGNKSYLSHEPTASPLVPDQLRYLLSRMGWRPGFRGSSADQVHASRW